MIVRIVRLELAEAGVAPFLENFEQVKDRIRAFPGCQRLELHRDAAAHNVYYTLSHWDSEDALNAYRHSELFAGTWEFTKKLFAGKPMAFSLEQQVALP